MANSSRATGTGVLLIKNHLLFNACGATTPVLGPADTGPAGLAELALPGFALFDKTVFIAGTAAKADRFKLATEVVAQPIGHLDTKGFVTGAKA